MMKVLKERYSAIVGAVAIVGGLFGGGLLAGVPAVDLNNQAQRTAQPVFTHASLACNVVSGLWAQSSWAYRYHITQAWRGDLPQWPSVNMKPTVTDWRGYDRLVIDVYNDAPGGDTLCAFLSQADGRLQNGLNPRPLPLGDYAYARWVIPLKNWPEKTNPAKIGRVHFFMTTPVAADVYLNGFTLLKPGEELPPVSEEFMRLKVEPNRIRAAKLQRERRLSSLNRFWDACRKAGQTGEPAWFGKATSMTKVRPCDDFSVEAADAFSLSLARGEYESLQVLVMPNGKDLKGVKVSVENMKCDNEVLPAAAFHCAPMGYVKTVNPAPYRIAHNVATNLPGGYNRVVGATPRGWWPDPILDYLTQVDIDGETLQSFWIRLKCPDGQKAGIYKGKINITAEGWQKQFPFTVRVYDFAVPKASPLNMAITFAPGPSSQFADADQIALNKKLRADPLSPVNLWRKHEMEWGNFLADYYVTMDSLYHGGLKGIHWEVLLELKKQGRLGLYNFGYWSYPADMKEETLNNWKKQTFARFDPVYAKARELGLLDRAYLYGCDEISPQYFENIDFALTELRKRYPEVPLFTTAYDHDFGLGAKLGTMDWFTPLTPKYQENYAKVEPSRKAGHQVWWYICCGPHAPHANMFVEHQAIEGRQLMGAQTIKYRPDGFLYYQISIWNSLSCIDGPSSFTSWDPRSWTTYHGDGSWFCVGPDGTPCATIRMENFRDGLEDYAYALEYEKRTGKKCEVPVEVCRDMAQYSDDPVVYYQWRNRLAEAIEKAK